MEIHLLPLPPAVHVPRAQTHEHSGVRRESCVCLNESFHQSARPRAHENWFSTEEYGLGITMGIERGDICWNM